MRNIGSCLGVIGLLSIPALSSAQSTVVNALRYWTQPQEARLVFDVSALPEHNIYMLQNPPRLVVDLKATKLTHKFGKPPTSNFFFSTIETGSFNDNNLRVVIELKKNSRFKDFSLPPNKVYGNRLVIDLVETKDTSIAHGLTPEHETPKLSPSVTSPKLANTATPTKNAPVEALANDKSAATLSEASHAVPKAFAQRSPQKNESTTDLHENSVKALAEPTKSVMYAPKASAKEIIVAIDAGHGGEDPGAHGPSGTEEKRVVLAIARKLANLLKKHPGITPVMVREGDYFIKLRKRIDIAREAKADLFVSIHADAYRDADVKGASVFTLSSNGASSEAARWLADSENAADLIGGVSLDDKDDMLASVLLDLSQTATLEASSDVARKVLTHFKQVNQPLHKTSVQKAGFLVLKSPDIPSILVETAFISNPSEEAKLRSETHQEQMATAIFKGILAYFKQNAPTVAPTMRVAKLANTHPKAVTRHAVIAGETLSGIAQQYGITTQELKSANAMEGRNVKPGQLLRIPANT